MQAIFSPDLGIQGPISAVLRELAKHAQHDTPDGFSFTDSKPVEAADSGPRGFVARYWTDTQDIHLVFQVLDMSQPLLRIAAKFAETNSARRGKSETQSEIE